jgi:hypothetical protein
MVRNGEVPQALHDEKKKSSMNFAQQETSIKNFKGKTQKNSTTLHNKKQ